jgi:hypothetical protein
MNGKQSPGPEHCPDHPATMFDAACDRFEAAWPVGRRPRIERTKRGCAVTHILSSELGRESQEPVRATRPNPTIFSEKCPGSQPGSDKRVEVGA